MGNVQVQILKILPSPNPCTRLKHRGKYKYNYCVKNSITSTKYFDNLIKYSQIHRTLHLCVIMVKVKAMKTQKQTYFAFIHYLSQDIK